MNSLLKSSVSSFHVSFLLPALLQHLALSNCTEFTPFIASLQTTGIFFRVSLTVPLFLIFWVVMDFVINEQKVLNDALFVMSSRDSESTFDLAVQKIPLAKSGRSKDRLPVDAEEQMPVFLLQECSSQIGKSRLG
jgi:hypothetical protein